MIISFQTPEERWVTTTWETPIFVGEIGIKSVMFVPAGPIFPDGGTFRLVVGDGKEDIAWLMVDQDIRRFQIVSFHVEPHPATYRILTLRKEISMGKNIAIPGCLIQVESWQ